MTIHQIVLEQMEYQAHLLKVERLEARLVKLFSFNEMKEIF
jgi:hypothetical protein